MNKSSRISMKGMMLAVMLETVWLTLDCSIFVFSFAKNISPNMNIKTYYA